MNFIVDSTLLEGTTTVVFENLYTEDIELAVHADIDDEGQSVHWSLIKTSAKDSKTDLNKGTLSRFDKIVDTVTYTNLIPGKEYTVKGILMGKETGKPIKVKGKHVTAEKSFVPKEADGTVDIVFHLDSRELDEKTVVVFEDLYHNGVLITSHADIKDKAQSITYPEKPEPVISIPKTGDTTNLLAYAGIALASLAAALAMAGRIRRKNAVANELKQYDREVFAIINLKTSGQIINLNICSVGTLNSSLISPREVFKSAILSNAAAFIAIHNHPSGNCHPSEEDRTTTERLMKCGEILDIRMLDHIIVAGETGEMLSMKKEGMMPDHHARDWER